MIVCLAGVILLAPFAGPGQAQGPAVTFFIAHVGTHEDASDRPIIAIGGRPVSFEVRVRDAGTTPKAGWQARLELDDCRFETPAAADVRFGDFMMPGSLIPVGPKIELKGNSVLIDQGQIALTGATQAPSGLLATITVTPKARVDCPDPGSAPLAEVTAGFDLAILAAPGGVKYEVTALAGRFLYLADGGPRLFLPLVMRGR
jgi:hypothetical protein